MSVSKSCEGSRNNNNSGWEWVWLTIYIKERHPRYPNAFKKTSFLIGHHHSVNLNMSHADT